MFPKLKVLCFIASWAEIFGPPEHGKNQAEYVCQAGTRLSGANWDVKFAEDHLPIFRVKPTAYVDPDSLFQHSESNSPPCIWIRQRVNAWSASCTRPQSWRRWRSKPSLVWKTPRFAPFLHVFFILWIFDPSSSSSSRRSVEEIKTVQQQRTLEEKQEDSGDKNIQEHVENALNWCEELKQLKQL